VFYKNIIEPALVHLNTFYLSGKKIEMNTILSQPSFRKKSKFQGVRLYPPFALFLLVTILISGCATLRPAEQPLSAHLKERDEAGECARFFKTLDQAVEEVGVSDRQDNRIPGFPYLRVNRFLASYSDRNLEKKRAVTAWVDRMQALDRVARKAEINNLPLSLREELHVPGGEANLQRRVSSCGELLREADLNSAENRQRLSARARVPPNYSTTKSIIGLYPLTSLFVRLGIAHYHYSIEQTYRTELARLPVSGHLVRYQPPAGVPPAAEARSIVEGATADPLGIPELTPEDQKRLFQAFAPIWEIDVSGDFDRPGNPSWADGPPLPTVDPTHPRVYTLLSHTRYLDRVLLQLNYVIWFPERPPQGMIDLFGGRLDGLIWRVTLNRHGTPLIYDTIHNCGCYHMFFPGPELTARQQKAFFSEPLLVPQRAPDLPGERKLVIRVASRTHYIDRIYAGAERVGEQTETYDLADYNALRSLPSEDGGHRSLFGPDALVSGTERGERWLLWPTGVSSPGAMRQWGNHATAFFGRRHFDDSDLLERFFESAPSSF